MWVFLLFLAVPLVEIGLFVVIGGQIGLWMTLGFVIGSAVLGVVVLRRSGQMARRGAGNLLMQAAGNGMSMMAGLLLILPGFLTSALGVLLMLPPVQRLIVLVLGQRLAAKGFVMRSARADETIIEGEYEEVIPPRDERLPPSKWTRS